MGYNYNSYTAALAAAIEVDPSDSDFVALEPTIIDQAEQRCYRDLDLLASVVTVPGTLVQNSRFFTLPVTSGSGTIHFLVVDSINVFDNTNTRHPLVPATRDTIDFTWPSETAAGASQIPEIFARISDTQVLVGGSPGTAWNVEVIGTIRPAPLSASNPDTYLSDYLSDLFFAASMSAAAGTLLKNYGAQSDSAQQAISWEQQYSQRLASAKGEELRKSFISAMSAPPVSAKDGG